MAATCSSFRLNMRMMMAASSTVALLLLCCPFIASSDSKNCDLYATKGRSFTVPLNHKLQVKDQLKWRHKDKAVFYRRGNDPPINNEMKVDDSGSLMLENVDDSKAGLYKVEVHDSEGRSMEQRSISLCTVDPLPKPTVTFSCASPIKFTCNVAKTQPDLKFEWMMDKATIEKKNSKDLTLAPKDVENKAISCKIFNNAASEVSGEVQHDCVTSESDFFQKLFTDYIWYLVGGGSGVVVLLILIVILCCVRAKRRDRLQLKDEEELRLRWTNTENNHQRQCSRPNDQHRHAHQQPAGHTGPRQHRPKQHHDQQRPRVPNNHPQPTPRRPAQAPRPPPSVDDEKPPPLPQPRKKAPKASRARDVA